MSVSAAPAAGLAPPHVDASGLAAYREYIEAPDHRAFAVAPGGAWGWSGGLPTAKAAEEQALASCQAQTRQRCVLFAADERAVFDAQNWPRLWRPYKSAAEARRAVVGREPGMRMADLAFADAAGRRLSISALAGKVVVLHFWGSWCGPCRRELPDMAKLQRALADRRDIVFVLLQAREKFDVARRWAVAQGIGLPLYDSGAQGDDDSQFRLAGGGRIEDRQLASRFPTTYVLDQRGLVVFSHVGPVHEWPQYEAFLRDAAMHGGR